MAKGNAIVMYLEQARIHGEPIGVTHSEVLFTKPNGYTVQPHNRVVSKADNKTMGESFLNELIYVLGAEDGEERKLPYDREVLVYTSDEINSDNYRTYINAVNTGINCPVHNFKLCQKLRRLCDERGYHLFFTLALDAEIIDEDAEEVSLTADPEQDADAALVSIEQEAALASDDEDDAAALERELSALEATLPTPTTFDPSGIEEDEDDSESFDMDSWLAEDVPENEPDIETEIELETEEPELSVEPELEPAKPAPEPPAKKEAAPKPARMKSDQNGKKDKTPSDTENSVKVNAFTKQENPVPVEEKPAPKQKPAKASKAKTPKTPESGTSKPATAPAPAPAKKPEADNRNDASLFGRGFQNRTTKGSGGGKKKANQFKKPEPYSEGEQMRFDGI